MKFRPGIRRSLLTALLAAVVCIAAAEAAVPQTPPQGVKGGSVSLERFRGKKSIVRGGRMPLPDSLRRDSLGRDSLRTAVDSTLLRLDSLGGALLPQDLLLLQLTGGDSLESNIRLVYNNARLAAQTAAELSRLQSSQGV